MYTLELYDGTKLQGLQRINPSTFVAKSREDIDAYRTLNEYNLSFALLFDEDDDDLLAGVFLDGMLQNYCNDGQQMNFRIGIAPNVMRESNRTKKKWDKEQGRCRK